MKTLKVSHLSWISVVLNLHLIATGGCKEQEEKEPVIPLAFAINSPALKSYSQISATVTLQANKEATVYYVLQEPNLTAPTVTQVREGKNGKNEQANISGNAEVIANQPKTVIIDLPIYSDNDIFFLLEDNAGETVSKKLSITNKLTIVKNTAATYSNLYSVLVSKDGEMILEQYYNGGTAGQLNDGRSLSKGIASLLVGKAMEMGFFTLETKLEDYLPNQYLSGLEEKKRNITVEQFLTMSSGLGGLESEFNQWIQVPDEIVYVLQKDMVSEPGAVWNYSTPNLQMLSVIFQEATGKSLFEFGDEYFFQPMEMDSVFWVPFETGYTLAGAFIFMTSRDYLKVGEMVLNNGWYDGKEIIKPAYLNEMTTNHFAVPPNTANSPKITSNWFGYLWWEIDRGNIQGYMTAGYAGQFIAVFPALKLVVVINSKANVNPATAVPQHMNATNLIADIVDAVQ